MLACHEFVSRTHPFLSSSLQLSHLSLAVTYPLQLPIP